MENQANTKPCTQNILLCDHEMVFRNANLVTMQESCTDFYCRSDPRTPSYKKSPRHFYGCENIFEV